MTMSSSGIDLISVRKSCGEVVFLETGPRLGKRFAGPDGRTGSEAILDRSLRRAQSRSRARAALDQNRTAPELGLSRRRRGREARLGTMTSSPADRTAS